MERKVFKYLLKVVYKGKFIDYVLKNKNNKFVLMD